MKFQLNLFVYLVLSLAIFTVSCRDKQEITFSPIADMPLHCYNGVMDEDETYIDGGGSCAGHGNSVPLTSSCFAPVDSVIIGAYKYKVTSCTTSVNGFGETEYSIQFPGGYITVTVSPGVYYNSELYVVNSSPSSSEYLADVYDLNYGFSHLTHGDLTIKTNGTSYALDLCDAYYYPSGIGRTVSFFVNVN